MSLVEVARTPSAFPWGERGKRPVRFCVGGSVVAQLLDANIPGLVGDVARGIVSCGWDLAPTIAKYTGLQAQLVQAAQAANGFLPSNTCPMPFPEAGERWWQAKLNHDDPKQRPRKHQVPDVEFLARRSWAYLANDMRCLSGDTVLTYHRAGGTRRTTLAELVHKFNGGVTWTGFGNARAAIWDSSIDTYTQSVDEEGVVRLNRIAAAHVTGLKPAFRLIAGTREIVSSADHEFLTVDGWVKLSELRAGAAIFVADYAKARGRERRVDRPVITGLFHHPFAARYTGVSHGRPAKFAKVRRARIAYEAALNNLDIAQFVLRIRMGDVEDLTFIDPADWEVHHKNGDILDDNPANLELVSRSDHARHHSFEARSEKRLLAKQVTAIVTSITEVAPVEMFDLTMESPRNNYVANDFIVHNCGKTFSAISTAMRLDMRHVLCVVPARAKLGWAREIARVTGEASLVLEGRGANEAREICLICGGRGYSTGVEARTTCAACAGSGDKYYHIRNAGPVAPVEYDVESYLSPTDGNGDPWPDGQEHLLEISASLYPPMRAGCKDHRRPKQGAFNYCLRCKQAFDKVFDETRFIIANPEIFIKHKESTGEGRTVLRSDLPGFGGRYGPLWMKNWSAVFIDEAHQMRARNYESMFKTRTHRNDRIYDAILDAPRVYALSGTPVFGGLADLYTQFNLISKGLFGDKPFTFDERYCSPYIIQTPNGPKPTCKHPETGYWTPTGKTDVVATELLPRQKLFMRRVTRAEVNPDQPPIQNQIEYLENPDAERGARGLRLAKKDDVRKEIRRLSKLKHETVAENVIQEMMNEHKSYCLVYNVVEARQLAKLIEEQCESRELRGRMRAVNAKVFLLTGETVKNAKLLEQICEDFRNHKGAACVVATYHQTQGFISLNGASFVHCVDWFESALGMQQSIRRAYELFSEKLTVLYYTMRGTVDTRLERLVLPSLEAALAVSVTHDKDLADMKKSLDAAASPAYAAAKDIEGASPLAAYVDEEGRLILPLTSTTVVEREAASATANEQRTLDNLFAEAPEGIDADVFKLILADAAEIDENDTRNYNWGPGGAGGGGVPTIDKPDDESDDAESDEFEAAPKDEE